MPATHARTQVRAAVIAAIGNLTTTGARVYSGRARPTTAGSGPYLLVYTPTTGTVPDGRPPRKFAHDTTLIIEGRAAAGEAAAIEALLDQIELEVQTAIAADAPLAALVKDIVPIRSTISVQAPGERNEGEVRLEYSVEYRTAETAPGVIIS